VYKKPRSIPWFFVVYTGNDYLCRLLAFAASISALIARRFAVFFERDFLLFPTPDARFAI
jgi:hypothetical protein